MHILSLCPGARSWPFSLVISLFLALSIGCGRKPEDNDQGDPRYVQVAELVCTLGGFTELQIHFDKPSNKTTLSGGRIGSIKCSLPPSEVLKEIPLRSPQISGNAIATKDFGEIRIALKPPIHPDNKAVFISVSPEQKDRLLEYFKR